MDELSVVLISKNQEWNISRLVESVLRETASFGTGEIILIDSASTDHTAEIAARYPITVLKLCPDQRLTAAAGRYVGYKQTAGDLVLFLDGDMELCEGWLSHAFNVLRSRPDAAAITGILIDRPMFDQAFKEDYSKSPNIDAPGVMEVRQGGGAALYRRDVLQQVGTFNPYLYSDEEPELCLRIRQAGFKILKLSRPIVFHYSAPFHTLSTLLGRRNRNLYLGFGQNIRYLSTSPLLWLYLKERGWVVAPALIFLLGIVAATASVVTGQWKWIALWGAVLPVLTAGIAVRKRSLKRALFTLLQRLIILDGTVRGLLLTSYDPASYLGRYKIVQSIRN